MENYAIKKFAIAVGCADVYCLKSAADDGLFKIFIRHKTIVDIIINNKNVNKSNKPSGCFLPFVLRFRGRISVFPLPLPAQRHNMQL